MQGQSITGRTWAQSTLDPKHDRLGIEGGIIDSLAGVPLRDEYHYMSGDLFFLRAQRYSSPL